MWSGDDPHTNANRLDHQYVSSFWPTELSHLEKNDEALWFQSVNELKKELITRPIKASNILIKASRSIGLEDVLEAFTNGNEA